MNPQNTFQRPAPEPKPPRQSAQAASPVGSVLQRFLALLTKSDAGHAYTDMTGAPPPGMGGQAPPQAGPGPMARPMPPQAMPPQAGPGPMARPMPPQAGPMPPAHGAPPPGPMSHKPPPPKKPMPKKGAVSGKNY